MATIKSYTSLEQSRKLAEILPLESADMEYLAIKEIGKLVASVPFVKDDSEVEDSVYSHTYDRIACWSLAALLGVLPEYIDYDTIYHPHIMRVKDNNYMVLYSSLKHSEIYDNPVDACFKMIIHLNELNLL